MVWILHVLLQEVDGINLELSNLQLFDILDLDADADIFIFEIVQIGIKDQQFSSVDQSIGGVLAKHSLVSFDWSSIQSLVLDEESMELIFMEILAESLDIGFRGGNHLLTGLEQISVIESIDIPWEDVPVVVQWNESLSLLGLVYFGDEAAIESIVERMFQEALVSIDIDILGVDALDQEALFQVSEKVLIVAVTLDAGLEREEFFLKLGLGHLLVNSMHGSVIFESESSQIQGDVIGQFCNLSALLDLLQSHLVPDGLVNYPCSLLSNVLLLVKGSDTLQDCCNVVNVEEIWQISE